MNDTYTNLLMKTATYHPSAVLLYKIAAAATKPVYTYAAPKLVAPVKRLAGAAGKEAPEAAAKVVEKVAPEAAEKAGKKGTSLLKNFLGQARDAATEAGKAIGDEASRFADDVKSGVTALKGKDTAAAKDAFKSVLKNPLTIGTGLGVAGAGSITGQAALLYKLLKDKANGLQGVPESVGAGAVVAPVIYGGLSLLPGAKRRRIMNAILAIMSGGATTATVLASKNKA